MTLNISIFQWRQINIFLKTSNYQRDFDSIFLSKRRNDWVKSQKHLINTQIFETLRYKQVKNHFLKDFLITKYIIRCIFQVMKPKKNLQKRKQTRLMLTNVRKLNFMKKKNEEDSISELHDEKENIFVTLCNWSRAYFKSISKIYIKK